MELQNRETVSGIQRPQMPGAAAYHCPGELDESTRGGSAYSDDRHGAPTGADGTPEDLRWLYVLGWRESRVHGTTGEEMASVLRSHYGLHIQHEPGTSGRFPLLRSAGTKDPDLHTGLLPAGLQPHGGNQRRRFS